MEIANVRVRLDKLGSDVPKAGVTPAEALLLHILHQTNNGGSTFGEDMSKIEVLEGEAETVVVLEEAKGRPYSKEYVPAVTKSHTRTNAEEYRRLQSKYGGLTNKKDVKILSLIFPDRLNPKFPEKFSDLNWKEIQFDGSELGSFDFGTSGGLAITQ